MPIPDYQTLLRPVLHALQTGPIGLRVLVDQLSDDYQLNENERQQLTPSGRSPLMYNRVAWAVTYLRKAGLLASPNRGMCEITPEGLVALRSGNTINAQFLKQYAGFQQFQSLVPAAENTPLNNGQIPNDITLPPQERLETAYQELHASLADDLLEQVKQQTPRFFELLVVQLMQAMGYGGWSENAGQATQYSNDAGVDGIINEDPLGLDTIYLQAKRYTENAVGRPEVQAFVGALEMKRAKKGVFITTSRFSREALEYVNLIEKRVVLIDGQRLAELMIHYNLGVSVRETYSIKHIDSDYFSDNP